MSSYQLVATGRERRFEIVVGLQEGYDSHGWRHTIEDAINAHHVWQQARGAIQGVVITEGCVSYGYPYVGARGEEIRGAWEPAAVLTGTINALYDATTPDDEARERILSLARAVGNGLGQTRVYVTFDGVAYIFEAMGKRAHG